MCLLRRGGARKSASHGSPTTLGGRHASVYVTLQIARILTSLEREVRMEISGKKVVVIGGASGMGRASAELLHERGAQVAVLDREGSDGMTVAEGIGAKFYPVDVTDFAGTEETLQAAVDDLGGLHVTVTTAGGGIAKRTMTKSGPHDLESFQSVVNLNLIATFNISRLAPEVVDRG